MAAAAMLRLFWRAGRAHRAGASWAEVLDAASGRLRPGAAVLLLASAYAALPAFLVASLAAMGGALGRTGLWVATLAPPLLLAAAAAALARRAPRPPRTAAHGGAARAARALAIGFLTLTVVAVGVGAWLLLVARWSHQIRDRAEAPSRVGVAFHGALARRYRSPAEPSVSAERAGQALHAVMSVGKPAPGAPHLLPPLERFEDPWLPSGIEGDVGFAYPDWAAGLLRAAGTGALDPAARRALLEAAPHPAAPLFGLAARAEDADLVSARLRLPAAPGVTALDVLVPDYVPLHLAAYARVGSAALALDAGDAATAERLLRDVVAVGVVMHDAARMEADAAAGATVARIGLDGLATLFEVTGRPAEAAGVRTGLAAAAGAAGQGSGAAWDALWRGAVAACVNLPALLFGAPEGLDAWLAARARALVRRPSDAAWFDLLVGPACSPLTYM